MRSHQLFGAVMVCLAPAVLAQLNIGKRPVLLHIQFMVLAHRTTVGGGGVGTVAKSAMHLYCKMFQVL